MNEIVFDFFFSKTYSKNLTNNFSNNKIHTMTNIKMSHKQHHRAFTRPDKKTGDTTKKWNSENWQNKWTAINKIRFVNDVFVSPDFESFPFSTYSINFSLFRQTSYRFGRLLQITAYYYCYFACSNDDMQNKWWWWAVHISIWWFLYIAARITRQVMTNFLNVSEWRNEMNEQWASTATKKRKTTHNHCSNALWNEIKNRNNVIRKINVSIQQHWNWPHQR